MIFLSVVIVFAILQLWGKAEPVQNDAWLQRIREMSVAVLGDAKQSYGVIIFPVFLLALITVFISDWLFGLIGLVLYIVVLLYSLGRGDLAPTLTRYLDAWQRGDKQADMYIASEWGVELPEDVDENELHQLLRKRFLYLSFERWFAVLFWFVIFGPAGALLYRLCRLEQDRGQEVTTIVHYLDWIPVRLLGLAASMVGDFSNCFDVWRRDGLDPHVTAEQLCDDYVVAALRLDTSGLNDSDLDMRSQAIIEWSEVQNLVHRCVVVWMIAIAIITII